MKSSKYLAFAGLVSVCVFVQPTFSYADDSEAAAVRSIKDVMGDMGTVAKALSQQLANPAANADSADKTNQLRSLALEVLPLVPEKVGKMPEGTVRNIEFLEYQKLIATLHSTLSALQVNFLKNENAAAADTFKQVKALQKQGHDRFRSPE